MKKKQKEKTHDEPGGTIPAPKVPWWRARTCLKGAWQSGISRRAVTFLPQGKLPPKCPWNVWKLSICTHFQMGYYGYITMDILPFIMDYGYIAHNTQVQNVVFTSASAGCRVQRFGTWDSPLEVMKLRPQPSRLFKCSPITKNWPAVYLSNNNILY